MEKQDESDISPFTGEPLRRGIPAVDAGGKVTESPTAAEDRPALTAANESVARALGRLGATEVNESPSIDVSLMPPYACLLDDSNRGRVCNELRVPVDAMVVKCHQGKEARDIANDVVLEIRDIAVRLMEDHGKQCADTASGNAAVSLNEMADKVLAAEEKLEAQGGDMLFDKATHQMTRAQLEEALSGLAAKVIEYRAQVEINVLLRDQVSTLQSALKTVERMSRTRG